MALPVARCNKVHWHHLDQSAQSLPMPKPACTRPQTLTCDLKWLSKGTLVVAWAVGSNSSTSGQSSRGPPPNSSISPTRLLHTVEFSAIAIAAIAQAALLVSTAVCQWHQTSQIADLQDHLSTMDGPGHATATHASTHQHHNQQQQQSVMQLQYQQQPLVPAAHSGLHLVTGSALVVGLLCGAGLRQLQTRHHLLHSSSGLQPSADAAVRLAALEVTSQQTAAQLTTTARQMDKLQARVRLATTDLKQPIKAAQGAAAQQAAALLKLSDQQVLLQKQVDGSQELIAALQGLAAKQFKVSAEALQQLKHGQTQLSGSTNKVVRELQRQQQALQQQLQSQQHQLRMLEQQTAVLQSQQQPPGAMADGCGSSSYNSSIQTATPPDPWQPKSAAAAVSPTGTASNSSDSGSTSSHRGAAVGPGRSSDSGSGDMHDVPPSNGHSGIPDVGLTGASPSAASPLTT